MTAMIVFTQPLKSAAVGAYLESLREQAGFSPNHMAAYLGYTRKQVQNWEAGTSPVKRAILISYAIASGQDPDGVVQRAAELADREESGVSVGLRSDAPRISTANAVPVVELSGLPRAS